MKEMKPELKFVIHNLRDIQEILEVDEVPLTNAVLALTMAVEHVGRILSDLTDAYVLVNNVEREKGLVLRDYSYSLPGKPKPRR